MGAQFCCYRPDAESGAYIPETETPVMMKQHAFSLFAGQFRQCTSDTAYFHACLDVGRDRQVQEVVFKGFFPASPPEAGPAIRQEDMVRYRKEPWSYRFPGEIGPPGAMDLQESFLQQLLRQLAVERLYNEKFKKSRAHQAVKLIERFRPSFLVSYHQICEMFFFAHGSLCL